jgi:hypothetical protein
MEINDSSIDLWIRLRCLELWVWNVMQIKNSLIAKLPGIAIPITMRLSVSRFSVMMGAIVLFGAVSFTERQAATAAVIGFDFDQVIGFDELRDLSFVDNQYRPRGADFENTALSISTLTNSLNQFYPPNSDPMVIADYPQSKTPGVIRVDAVERFWTTVGGYVTGRSNIVLTAFNVDHQVLGQTATGGANYACGTDQDGNFFCPGTGIAPNQFLNLSFPNIAYVTFTGDTGQGNSFTIDDFSFNQGAEIPTPAMLPGMIGLGIQAWRKRGSLATRRAARSA